MKDKIILRIIAKFIVPLVMLFGLYVQFHGDYSPGGGFQAGVIFAAALILYTLVFGTDKGEQVIPPGVLRLLMSVGVLLFTGVGVAALLRGGEFLNYSVLAAHAKEGQHLGIILIELGVGITVAAVMLVIFFAFLRRSRL